MRQELCRVQFAEKHVYMSKKWRRVAFTDGKSSSLDGPDGFHYYCRDLRKEQQLLSRRFMAGGGITIWRVVG